MSIPFFRPNEIIGFALMLLMFVALVAGQADATARAAGQITATEPAVLFDDHLNIDIDGNLGTTMIRIAVDVATDLDYFQGAEEGNR